MTGLLKDGAAGIDLRTAWVQGASGEKALWLAKVLIYMRSSFDLVEYQAEGWLYLAFEGGAS